MIYNYLYFRYSKNNNKDIIKVGITSNIKNRDNGYITGEYYRGYYMKVFRIPYTKIQMQRLEKKIKKKFRKYYRYVGGGTEFYNINILNLIESYLQELNIKYTVLSRDDINNMARCSRIRKYKIKNNKIRIKNRNRLYHNKYIKQINNNKILSITNNIFKPQDYQLEITKESYILQLINPKIEYIKPNTQQQYVLDTIDNFYESNNIGKLIWACGLGKALLSIQIVKLLQFKSIIIGVSSNILQAQISNEILKIFPNYNNILFVGGNSNNYIQSRNNIEDIKLFLNKENNNEPIFIITTYHSSYILVDTNINVNLKIGDESHHLVGIKNEDIKGFCKFHNIKSTKSLFMTATEKIMDNNTNIYTMDDTTSFGKYIDVKSIKWGIDNKKITDYNVILLKNNITDINDIIKNNNLQIKDSDIFIFISCYMCLTSFTIYPNLTHILLYTNTTTDAELAKVYINDILTKNIISIPIEYIYNNALHSKYSTNLDIEINKFKNSMYGIISCVRIFGEGFNEPKLNSVCVAGNMTSQIRIVQSLLRPNRLDINNPNKMAYIIIPYIDGNDIQIENKSFNIINNVIYNIRNVDESVIDKIYMLTVNKKIPINQQNNILVDNNNNTIYNFEPNDFELNKIKLKLKYSKALDSNLSEEQDEYNYVRSVNIEFNIKSMKEYHESKNKWLNFISLPEEYFKLKGVWTDLYDFMGTNTTIFIQSKSEWINYCKKINIISLNDYYKSCEHDNCLPKEPKDFYEDFSNILYELDLEYNNKRF